MEVLPVSVGGGWLEVDEQLSGRTVIPNNASASGSQGSTGVDDVELGDDVGKSVVVG